MPIHFQKPILALAASSLMLGLLLAPTASAAPVAAGPTTSPVCAPPCVEDARVRPKANVHDPDKDRPRAAEPAVREQSDQRTAAPADKEAPVDGHEQRPRN